MTGTPTADPSDSRERVEAALKPWGWTCGDDFWRRYHQDAWVFNLVNALTRTTAEVERLQTASRDVINEWNDGGEWIREQFESALTALARLVGAEVIDR